MPCTSANGVHKGGARQLCGDGRDLATLGRGTGPRLRSDRATASRRTTCYAAATAGPAQARRQERIVHHNRQQAQPGAANCQSLAGYTGALPVTLGRVQVAPDQGGFVGLPCPIRLDFRSSLGVSVVSVPIEADIDAEIGGW